MKFKSALLLISLFSAAAQAGYVDYRHEYYDDGRNYDRVYMSHRFATGFGVAVEAISRSENTQSNDAWNNMESNGNEYTASYQFTWKDLIWQPGIAIETGDNIAIYKPYIYKIADSEDLYNNRKDDYEYNFRVAYKIGSWVPFVEVGNVSSGYNTTTTDDRQTRYRVGLGYNF